MSDGIIPYLRFDPNAGNRFARIPIESLPFPTHYIPEVFNLPIFFIERIDAEYFLRCTLNSFFCAPIHQCSKEIEIPEWDPEAQTFVYNDKGEVIQKLAAIHYLRIDLEMGERVVGYSFEGKSKTFLVLDSAKVPLAELDEKLQILYSGARLMRNNLINHHEKRIRELELADMKIKPKGKWESEMFEIIFNGDPNLMSDEEYEMIFGEAR